MQDKADRLAGSDPDYVTRQLFELLEKDKHPKWTLYIQFMPEVEAETLT